MIEILAVNAALLMITIIILWAISVRIRDVSFIDSFWAFGMVMLAISTFVQAHDGSPERKFLILALTGIWGLRLSLQLGELRFRFFQTGGCGDGFINAMEERALVLGVFDG